jgi:multiple antibiotic resistance protein
MIEAFVSAFVTLFVVIDPPGCAPIFAGLTRECTPAQRRAMALRSTLVASGILVFFGILGFKLLHALGISLAAFRISGGIMMFMIALDMVFERRTQRRESRAEEVSADPEHNDISVFPMGIPMIAGPGSIASAMLLMSRAEGLERSAIVLAALGAVLVLTLLSLLGAAFLMRLLGSKLEAMLTRLLGVILAALAAQFVIDGLTVSFGV